MSASSSSTQHLLRPPKELTVGMLSDSFAENLKITSPLPPGQRPSTEMSDRRTTADRLLGQIYLWIFKAEQFALVLRKQAIELETALTQGGGLTTAEEIVLDLLTIPYSYIFGPLFTAITCLTSATSVTLESKLEKNKRKGQNALKIEEEVQKLNKKLKSESESKKAEDVDRYVLFELLKSLGKSEGFSDPSSTGAIEQLMNNFLKNQLKNKVFKNAMMNLLGLLQFFGINISVKHDAKVSGGLDVLSSSLQKAFGKCKKALEENDGAKAGKILKNISDSILTASEKLSELSYDAQSWSALAVQNQTNQCYQYERREGGVAIAGVTRGEGGIRHEEEDDSEEDNRDDEETAPKKLRMALLNVRSITKKAITKDSLIKNLILDHKLDFFLTTETWLKPGPEGDEALCSVLPRNRNFIHQPRGDGRRGGGVAIVYSDQFDCRRVELPKVTTFEYVAASVKHRTWDRPILIITVYHTTSKNYDDFLSFMDEFKGLMKCMSSGYSSFIVAGDFNIWIDDEQKRPGREFLEFLRSQNLQQFVDEPTHKKGHTLDLVIGREMEVTNVIVNDDNKSDHCTVSFEARPKNESDQNDEL